MWHYTKTTTEYRPEGTCSDKEDTVKKHEVKDSGQRRQFETGAVRDIQDGKGRLDLIPPLALERLSKHYEKGATLDQIVAFLEGYLSA